MKKMYKLSIYFKEIEERNVVKETAHFVTYISKHEHEVRDKKNTEYYKWFNSREEAESEMANILKERVESAEQKLKKAREEYLNYITSLAS
jgi:hypothetical protein